MLRFNNTPQKSQICSSVAASADKPSLHSAQSSCNTLLAVHHQATLNVCSKRYAGGSGKTTMVQLLFNHLSPRFTNRAIIYLDAQDLQGTKTQEHLGNMLHQLGMQAVDRFLPAPTLLKQLQHFVASKSVLLVIDNVWTAEQLDGLLPADYGAGSHLLITSREESLLGSRGWQVSLT
jgi:hypothetical protein